MVCGGENKAGLDTTYDQLKLWKESRLEMDWAKVDTRTQSQRQLATLGTAVVATETHMYSTYMSLPVSAPAQVVHTQAPYYIAPMYIYVHT